MRKIAYILEKTIGKDCTIARIDNSKFAFLHSVIEDDHHEELEVKIQEALKEINVIDGSPVTIYADISLSLASDCDNQENEIFMKAIAQISSK